MFRQLEHSQAKRREEQRQVRERLGFTGEKWDSLVEAWEGLRQERLYTLWEYAEVASRVADEFGDDALEHFATQVQMPSRGLRRAAQSYRDTVLQRLSASGAPYASEDRYVFDLQQRLIARGFTVKREASTQFGRVDLLASIPKGRGNESIQLIEAKLSADWREAAQALGQLLFYRGSFAGTRDIPDRQMWFACPDKPNESVLKILNRYGVSYIS